MTQVIVNDALRGMLHDLKVPLELCDEKGQVLCRLTPVSTAAPSESTEPPLSREERDERAKDKSVTYTTAEVLAHLESL